MKKLLWLFLICSASASQAENQDWYLQTDRACSTGNPLEESRLEVGSKTNKYRVSDDLTRLVKMVDGKPGAETYALTQVGKHQYVASPENLEPGTDATYFFIAIDDDRSQLSLYTSDTFGTVCGGGLIVVSMSKDPSSKIE